MDEWFNGDNRARPRVPPPSLPHMPPQVLHLVVGSSLGPALPLSHNHHQREIDWVAMLIRFPDGTPEVSDGQRPKYLAQKKETFHTLVSEYCFNDVSP